jgi:hypothetical protein
MLKQSDTLYRLYVLRVWRNGQDDPWRASLDFAHTGERLPFATLPELYAFLESETGNAQPPTLLAEDTGDGDKSQTEGE